MLKGKKIEVVWGNDRINRIGDNKKKHKSYYLIRRQKEE